MTPAHNFRVLAPLTLIVLLISVGICVQIETVRWWLAGSFVALIVTARA
ncbi:MAG: hypothetical protein ABI035_09130 [Gemmatimonadaceae bacterium]